MTRQRINKIIIAIIAVMLLLSGCGYVKELFGDKSKGYETTPIIEEPNEEPEPYPVTIDGVTLNQTPLKIVCLSPSLCEIMYEFGEELRLIGKSGYCAYPPDIMNVPNVSEAIALNVEDVIKIAPDLLLTSAPVSLKDRKDLELSGITTIVISAPKTIEEFRTVYKIMGVIFNGGFIGEETGESVFADISHALDNKNVIDWGNFIYITENMAPATGDTLESAVFSCFGNNLAKDAALYSFDKETLLENQPDVILLSDIYALEDLYEDEVYSRLNAVLEEQIVFVNNVYFEKPSARVTELITEVLTEYISMKG